MALVSGPPEMDLLVGNRVGSNPTIINIVFAFDSCSCFAPRVRLWSREKGGNALALLLLRWWLIIQAQAHLTVVDCTGTSVPSSCGERGNGRSSFSFEETPPCIVADTRTIRVKRQKTKPPILTLKNDSHAEFPIVSDTVTRCDHNHHAAS